METVEKAKKRLQEGGYTCVLMRGEEVHSSRLRGVRPLLDFLDSPLDLRGFAAADKTVGAGAAHLYVLLGVSAVWAGVISEAGKRVLEENGIPVLFDTCVPYIINRAGNGCCPIEAAVQGISDPKKALAAIKETLAALSGN